MADKFPFAQMSFYRRFKAILGRRGKDRQLEKYNNSGRIPWSPGYDRYKSNFITDVLNNNESLELFRKNMHLPTTYGARLDERVVEYPWIIARLNSAAGTLLDAGSALNFKYILDTPMLNNKSIVIYTLAPEHTIRQANVSYIYGDLRHTIIKSRTFDEIVCISTLEHIGLDNTMLYAPDEKFNENRPSDYKKALSEFHRQLASGGRLLMTVPFGRYEHHGWLQQFDAALLDDAIKAFGGKIQDQAYYRYTSDGWTLATATECADCSYFDIHASNNFDPDYAAAARAVACVELTKE